MKAQSHTKHIAEFLKSATQQFGDFSEDKKQEIYLIVKEAKTAARPMFERVCKYCKPPIKNLHNR